MWSMDGASLQGNADVTTSQSTHAVAPPGIASEDCEIPCKFSGKSVASLIPRRMELGEANGAGTVENA